MTLQGFHHLTAITANPAANVRFHTQTLGLRLVKKTVNQDDVSAYHLFYADGEASPGTDITFFDWPLPPARRGTRSIVRTGFRVASIDSLRYWSARLREAGVAAGEISEHTGRPSFDFEDPEGQRLAIVADDAVDAPHPWARSPVPPMHQIRGLGPITVSVPALGPTQSLLTGLMRMRRGREYAAAAPSALDGRANGDSVKVYVYHSGDEGGPLGAAAELHVAVEPDAPPARTGAGGVHHVAFRVPTFADYDAWNQRLAEFDVPSSGPVDRFYFRSLYFREPSGILMELATDGPGFATDEPLDELGQRLALPHFLEARRTQIERGLKPLMT